MKNMVMFFRDFIGLQLLILANFLLTDFSPIEEVSKSILSLHKSMRRNYRTYYFRTDENAYDYLLVK